MLYTYRYIKHRDDYDEQEQYNITELNVSESSKMDGQRVTMGRNSEQLRKSQD